MGLVTLSDGEYLFQPCINRVQIRETWSCRLNTIGYRVGLRVSELLAWRNEGSSKAPKREIRLRDTLLFVHTQVWKAVFGKPADGVEKSVEKDDECTFHYVECCPLRLTSLPRLKT
jgi:hypothetical protein